VTGRKAVGTPPDRGDCAAILGMRTIHGLLSDKPISCLKYDMNTPKVEVCVLKTQKAKVSKASFNNCIVDR
jgi:hypothetical protein